MTKALNEQWRDGTLPDGYYYIDYDTQQRIFEIEDGCATYQGLPAETYFLNDVCLIKVIAPVPSYDVYKGIDELLNQEIKASQQNALKASRLIFEKRRLLSENKKLKEQLQEANNIIVKADWDCDYELQKKCGFSEYLKKYNIDGVK